MQSWSSARQWAIIGSCALTLAACSHGGRSAVAVEPPPLPASWMTEDRAVGTFWDEDGNPVRSRCEAALRVAPRPASDDEVIYDATTLRDGSVLVDERWKDLGGGEVLRHRYAGVEVDTYLDACCAAWGCGAFVVEARQPVTVERWAAERGRIRRGERAARRESSAVLEAASMARLQGHDALVSEQVSARSVREAPEAPMTTETRMLPTLRALPAQRHAMADHVMVVEENVFADRPVVRVATVMEDVTFKVEGAELVSSRFYYALPVMGRRVSQPGWELEFSPLRPLSVQTLRVEVADGRALELSFRVAGNRPFALQGQVAPRVESSLPVGARAPIEKLHVRTPLGLVELPVLNQGTQRLYARCAHGESCGEDATRVCVPVPGTDFCVVSDGMVLQRVDEAEARCVAIPNTAFCADAEGLVAAVLATTSAEGSLRDALRAALRSLLYGGR